MMMKFSALLARSTAQVRHTSVAATNASFSSITRALICLRKYITHSIHTILKLYTLRFNANLDQNAKFVIVTIWFHLLL
jgi:hypothetical protein